MQGRKPTPSALKLVKGLPGKRAEVPKTEAEPPLSRPSPPEFLSDDAKVEWGRVIDRLFECGLMTDLDRGALAGYCDAYGTWVEASRQLRDVKALTKTTAKNNLVQHPLVGTIRVARADMLKFAVEFGMTPSARSRIDIGIGNPAGGEGHQGEGKAGKYF